MRIGVAGTGLIMDLLGPRLAPAGIDVVAISSTPRSVERAKELAQRHGARRCYSDWHKLIRDDEVEVVYVAVPNHLHFEVAKEALLSHKSVLCEKPLCSDERQAAELASLARSQGVFLWEAVVTPHQPNFKLIRDELLPRIGSVRQVFANFSQYSSRYDRFCRGDIAPVFNPAYAGGALMDLGLYTLSFTLGLFGEPKEARYVAHIERGIDTSGTIVLTYDGFAAVNVCAKDCDGPNHVAIEGTKGYLRMDTAPNFCGKVTLCVRGEAEKTFDESLPDVYDAELADFVAQWQTGDLDTCYAELEQSLLVSRVQAQMRRDAGIVFPTD